LYLQVQSPIVPVKGDCQPFLDFMEYLIPDPKDREHTMRMADPGYSSDAISNVTWMYSGFMQSHSSFG
jgi:hypothetical protein